jgi:hypothetical protein
VEWNRCVFTYPEHVTWLSSTTCFHPPSLAHAGRGGGSFDVDISTTRSPIATKLENSHAEMVENKREASKK